MTKQTSPIKSDDKPTIKVSVEQIVKDINNKSATIWHLSYQHNKTGHVSKQQFEDVLTHPNLNPQIVPFDLRVNLYKSLVFDSYVKGIQEDLKIEAKEGYIKLSKNIQELTFKTAHKFINEIIYHEKITLTDKGILKKYLAPLLGKMLAKLLNSFTIGASNAIGDGLKDLIMTTTETHGSSLHEISQQMIKIPDLSDLVVDEEEEGTANLVIDEELELHDVQTRKEVKDFGDIFVKLGNNLQNTPKWADQGISDFLIEIVDDNMVEENILASVGKVKYDKMTSIELDKEKTNVKSALMGMMASVMRFWSQPAIKKNTKEKTVFDAVLSPYEAAFDKLNESRAIMMEIIREELLKDVKGNPISSPTPKIIEPESIIQTEDLFKSFIEEQSDSIKNYAKRANEAHYIKQIKDRIAESKILDAVDQVAKLLEGVSPVNEKPLTKILLADMIATSKEPIFERSNRWNEGKKFSKPLAALLKREGLYPEKGRNEIIKGLSTTQAKKFKELQKQYNNKNVIINKLKLHQQDRVIGKVIKHDEDRSGYKWALLKDKDVSRWADNLAISEVFGTDYLAVPKGTLAGRGSTIISLDRAEQIRHKFIKPYIDIAERIEGIELNSSKLLNRKLDRLNSYDNSQKKPMAAIVDDLSEDMDNVKDHIYHTDKLIRMIYNFEMHRAQKEAETQKKENRKSI